MKTLKSSFGVFAAILGLMMAFAFTAPQPKAMVNPWFKYMGDDNGGGESNPENYLKTSVSSCGTGSYLCGIQAEEDGTSGIPTQAGVDDPDAITQQLSPEN